MITRKILGMIEARREPKNISQSRYQYMDEKVKTTCRTRKEEWLQKKVQRNGRTREN